MKKAFLTSIVFVFGGLCVQCSLASKSNNVETNNINQPVNGTALTNPGSNSDDLETTKESERLMLQFLKRESLTLGIKNLSETAIDDETEIRVWVSFGTMYPRCFILKTLNGTHKAFYVAPKKNDSKATRGKSV